MHHHRHRGWGGNARMLFRGSFPSRHELLERLESYQRDLEQQLADIADVIAHLRDRADEAPQQTSRHVSTAMSGSSYRTWLDGTCRQRTGFLPPPRQAWPKARGSAASV